MLRHIYTPNNDDWINPNVLSATFDNMPSPYKDKGRGLLKALRETIDFDGGVGNDKLWLEVSTRSDETLGVRLSAFNLKTSLSGVTSSVESIYQSSKVFQNGGPFNEMAKLPAWSAKMLLRNKNLGTVKGFKFLDTEYPVNPAELFYTFIYFKGLLMNLTKEDNDILDGKRYFTDIMSNPKTSVNTQAKCVARYVAAMYNKIQFPVGDKELLEFLSSHMKK